MNVHELSAMFPQVLSGELPLEVFADMAMDCGFAETGFMIQRLTVHHGVGQSPPKFLVVVNAVGYDDKPTGRKIASTRNDYPYTMLIANTIDEALKNMRCLAVHYVEWAIEHGEPKLVKRDLVATTGPCSMQMQH